MRWARYDFRHDQAEATARYYRSIIDNYYEANLQARPDAAEHGAEISAQPRPAFRYPAWMFEDLTIPADGLSPKLPTLTRKPGFRVVTTNGSGPPSSHAASESKSGPVGLTGKPPERAASGTETD